MLYNKTAISEFELLQVASLDEPKTAYIDKDSLTYPSACQIVRSDQNTDSEFERKLVSAAV